jgi:uncharacterized protein involved in exopolysaccharide biosynthesis
MSSPRCEVVFLHNAANVFFGKREKKFGTNGHLGIWREGPRNTASNEMSFSALSKIVWARKLTFFTVFILITAAAIAFCFITTPIFQSKAVVMVSAARLQTQQQAPYPDTLRYQINSQIYVIESEDVLRWAIAEIGVNTLFPDDRPNRWHSAAIMLAPWAAQLVPENVQTFFANMAAFARVEEAGSEIDRALVKAKKRLAVTAEKDSQVLSLTFRHEAPDVAEKFLQLVVEGFLKRQGDLTGNAVAPSFFRQQADHYRDDYKRASAEMSEFAQKHSTYSISQEIELALERRDEAVAALAKTRGSIAEKEAQAATLQNTLTQLRRRISLPSEVIGPKYKPQAGGDAKPQAGASTKPQAGAGAKPQAGAGAKPQAGAGATEDALTDVNRIPANESPLLLVRVFQETAQSLVNLNSSIIGSRALETAQEKSLAGVEQRLNELSSVQAEFGRLKSEVDQTAKILEAHVGRAAEAQMNADWDASEKLSSVKVVQSATRPLQPVFPPKPLLITLGAAIGLIGGAAASAALESMRQRRRRPVPRPEEASFERVRRIRQPDAWIPTHEVADYRVRR